MHTNCTLPDTVLKHAVLGLATAHNSHDLHSSLHRLHIMTEDWNCCVGREFCHNCQFPFLPVPV